MKYTSAITARIANAPITAFTAGLSVVVVPAGVTVAIGPPLVRYPGILNTYLQSVV
jgi:hypothetical protein